MFDWTLTFDWSWAQTLGSKPFYEIMWHFFINGGWILFLLVFGYGAWIYFVFSKQVKFAKKQNYIYLAIDIPKNNLQTPKAVENIFVALSGAHGAPTWYEKNIRGEFQLSFSFELVSIDGYAQFIIRTPVFFRNLVESSIYAQYPDAEITEVEDYVPEGIKFPSDEYNLWGTDIALVRPDYYPLKTYREFEDALSKEFKDPMAALLEVFNKIGPGEQIWLQIISKPADIGWEKKGKKAVEKILGLSKPAKETWADKISDVPLNAITFMGDQIFGTESSPQKKDDKKPFNLMAIPPDKQREVEFIYRKLSKIGWDCKIRFIYFGKKEVFKKALGVAGVFGALKQFATNDLNAIKPDKNKTSVVLWFKKMRTQMRQNKIYQAYKARNADTCKGRYTLNVEELATLYHFPYIEVKAPLVKKIEAKKASAPVGLPVDLDEDIDEPIKVDVVKPEDQELKESGSQESKSSEKVPVVDLDNDYFENKFAKDKTRQSDKKRKAEIMKKLEKSQKLKNKIKEDIDNSLNSKEVSKDKKDSSLDNLPFV